ncbi:glycosyltransferase family 2 protein [Chitinophaga niabensis]|uniref:glycosyltransferase family 2 protein n=1 Tax=Chitinophaga niabensis TaxID=536979 RepID=UPI0031BB96D8
MGFQPLNTKDIDTQRITGRLLDLSVSIVLYHTPEETLKACLASLSLCTLDMEILLIDNSEIPNSPNYIDNQKIRYIHNRENTGFGAGHNLGIKAFEGKSKYHLILNADVYFGENVLERIFDFMERNKQYAHLMPKVEYPDGSPQLLCRGTPTLSTILIKRVVPGRLHGLFRKKLNKYESPDFDHNTLQENIPFLSGCFMFLRTNAVNIAGGFDDRIFLYFEDAELTRRLLVHHKNVYFPEVTIWHAYGRGTKSKINHIIHAFKGLLIYLYKKRT